MTSENNHKYDDIIGLPHHVSVTGYGAAIQETGRLTDRKIELSEDERIVLDMKQQILLDNIRERPDVSITYFIPDERKDGGSYVTVTGNVKKIDDYQRLLILTDRAQIPLDEIVDIESELFNNIG